MKQNIYVRITLGLLSFCYMATHSTALNNIDNLFQLDKQAAFYSPTTIEELQNIVHSAAESHKKISLVGSDKSQGGQTISLDTQSIRISLKNLNHLIHIDPQQKIVTIEAGMTWAELQQHIRPYKLSVKAMQSFNDFSIGGSLGVNVHGQDLHHTPLIKTVISCKIMLADGSIVMASRIENKELFNLAIGGYGLLGIIIEVTLSLTDDILLDQKTTTINSSELAHHFTAHIKNNPSLEFYSARLSINPLHFLEKAIVITFKHSNSNNTSLFHSTSSVQYNWLKPLIEWSSRFSIVKALRLYYEYLYNKIPYTISRNNFLNYSIDILPKDNDHEMYILQEYFIPYEQINQFIKDLQKIQRYYHINILNISARHVHQDNESVLSFSPKNDSCAFVIYIKIEKSSHAYKHVQSWTKQVIDSALACNGTYYLPYHLLATKEQLITAYPRFEEFITLKKKYDTQELFSNALYEQYH